MITIAELTLSIILSFIVGIVVGHYIKVTMRFDKPHKERTK